MGEVEGVRVGVPGADLVGVPDRDTVMEAGVELGEAERVLVAVVDGDEGEVAALVTDGVEDCPRTGDRERRASKVSVSRIALLVHPFAHFGGHDSDSDRDHCFV